MQFQRIHLSVALPGLLSLIACRPTGPTLPRQTSQHEAVEVALPVSPEREPTVSPEREPTLSNDTIRSISKNEPELAISEEEAHQRAREYLLAATRSDELPRELWLDPTCYRLCSRVPDFADNANRAPPEKCPYWACVAFYGMDKIYHPGSVKFRLTVGADSVTDTLNGIGRCYDKPHRCRPRVSSAQARKIAGVSGREWTAWLTWDDAAGEFVWSLERTLARPAADSATIMSHTVSAHREKFGH